MLWVAGSASSATATIELSVHASGAVSNAVDVTSPVDDAHLCTAFASPGGGHTYMLRYAASPAASLLDPGSPGLVMTFANPQSAGGQLAPQDGSIQVAIGGQRFFGSSQPGAAFHLALSLQPDNAGGSFSARHLVDESGRQTIDIAGSWRCATPPAPARNAGQASVVQPTPSVDASASVAPAVAAEAVPPSVAPPARVADVAPAASPAMPASPAALSPPVPVPPVAQQQLPPAAASPPVPAPAVRPASSAQAAAVGRPPAPATSGDAPFRQLLATLGHDIAVPGPAAIAPEEHGDERSGLFGGRRVFIHYRQDSAAGQTMADHLARQLGPDFAHTEIRTVAATPGSAEIRYFFSADAAAAHALADTLGAAEGRWRVRSFTSYHPSPAPGTLELWVPAR